MKKQKKLATKDSSSRDPYGSMASPMSKYNNINKSINSEKDRAGKRPRSPTHEEIMSKIKAR